VRRFGCELLFACYLVLAHQLRDNHLAFESGRRRFVYLCCSFTCAFLGGLFLCSNFGCVDQVGSIPFLFLIAPRYGRPNANLRFGSFVHPCYSRGFLGYSFWHKLGSLTFGFICGCRACFYNLCGARGLNRDGFEEGCGAFNVVPNCAGPFCRILF